MSFSERGRRPTACSAHQSAALRHSFKNRPAVNNSYNRMEKRESVLDFKAKDEVVESACMEIRMCALFSFSSCQQHPEVVTHIGCDGMASTA
ncbi:hypothetical protein NPIL_597371 [Nephila pilipes]|nr:hypothetical protein NPIL_597371 [Nephila pilipes]